MGALRPLRRDSGDARACIENRFRIPARFFKFYPDEPEREDNLARSVVVQSKHARSKLLRPCGEDSGAHWKRDNVQGIGMMFHVKQS